MSLFPKIAIKWAKSRDEVELDVYTIFANAIRLHVVMGNPGLVRGPDLEVAVHNVAEPVTQPKTRLNTGRT